MKIKLAIVLMMGFLFASTFSATSPNATIHLNRFNLVFPLATAEDLDRGFIDIHYNTSVPDLFIQIKSKTSTKWDLFIKTEQPFFTSQNSNKPQHDLLWKKSHEPESNFRPVTLQKSRIATGIYSTNINLDFRLIVDWKNPPADYNLDFYFILESPFNLKYLKTLEPPANKVLKKNTNTNRQLY
jgi:hypothetical protein